MPGHSRLSHHHPWRVPSSCHSCHTSCHQTKTERCKIKPRSGGHMRIPRQIRGQCPGPVITLDQSEALAAARGQMSIICNFLFIILLIMFDNLISQRSTSSSNNCASVTETVNVLWPQTLIYVKMCVRFMQAVLCAFRQREGWLKNMCALFCVGDIQ